ncbi:uncharacterized protein CELE_T27F6.10 [Caenorhabditis elegans]|uniref:Uncharacterized protein n=1 Tax=Caenorhabditis elegans TaxID=6239 RepID=A9UJP6_CAEEL|nr:Uncharacterized protein CELE_T27F6.10 [Caenorhabditis elegans]CAP59532.1 Uncharacterized protein CELE_T27F6.10 [Caenorhabditis elegans]|eukprot:NP_001122524.1 Uncharacterized protein CELE_T27F6.10 [Caenorhabditis elegans]
MSSTKTVLPDVFKKAWELISKIFWSLAAVIAISFIPFCGLLEVLIYFGVYAGMAYGVIALTGILVTLYQAINCKWVMGLLTKDVIIFDVFVICMDYTPFVVAVSVVMLCHLINIKRELFQFIIKIKEKAEYEEVAKEKLVLYHKHHHEPNYTFNCDNDH